MLYLFSSKPKTIEEYLNAQYVEYKLVTKENYDEVVSNYEPKEGDFGIIYDFGKMIPESFLEKILLLNIHFSLLPKYRGAIPVEAAILNGETVTGISVQKMVKAMDAGPILVEKEVEIDSSWTAGELQSYMDNLLPLILQEIIDGQKTGWKFVPQEGEPSFCYIRELNRECAKIDWKNESSQKMVSKIRAYNPEPLAWIEGTRSGQKKTVNLLRAEAVADLDIAVGQYQFIKKRGLVFGLQDGAVLVTELVVEGSKSLKGGDIVALKGSIEF